MINNERRRIGVRPPLKHTFAMLGAIFFEVKVAAQLRTACGPRDLDAARAAFTSYYLKLAGPFQVSARISLVNRGTLVIAGRSASDCAADLRELPKCRPVARSWDPMSDERPSDVLGSLPRTRPHRRSDKRGAGRERAARPRSATQPLRPRSPTQPPHRNRSPARRRRSPRRAQSAKPTPRAKPQLTPAAEPSARSKPRPTPAAQRLRQPSQPRGDPAAPPVAQAGAGNRGRHRRHRRPGRGRARRDRTVRERPSAPQRALAPAPARRVRAPLPPRPRFSGVAAARQAHITLVYSRHFQAERSSVRGRSAGEPLAGRQIRRGESARIWAVAHRASPSAHPVGTSEEESIAVVSGRAIAKVVVLLAAGSLCMPALSRAASLSAPGRAASGSAASRAARRAARQRRGPARQRAATATRQRDHGSARISAILSHALHFTGTIASPSSGERVVIQRLDRQLGWLDTASARVAGDGSFVAVWRTNHIGRFPIRALLSPPAEPVPGRRPTPRRSRSPSTAPSLSTLYGTGSTARRPRAVRSCDHNTLGVAHRWLPCGTPVAIYYGGHTIVVPVIDRGPYANGADWDLTEATARGARDVRHARRSAPSRCPAPRSRTERHDQRLGEN